MIKRVLGVDLAVASWADNGLAMIEFETSPPRVISVSPGGAWPSVELTATALADAIDALARNAGVVAIAFDGPQGWRDPATPPGLKGVGRRCELSCRTPGKTGVHPQTYPGNMRRWIEFCVAVFDALLAKPGVVIAASAPFEGPTNGYGIIECFPTSTWRASGLTPLPAKARAPHLAPFILSLRDAFDLPPFATASHDDLQGVVAALSAMAVAGGPARAMPHGVTASITVNEGIDRRIEGFIWDAQPLLGPVKTSNSAPAAPPPVAPLAEGSKPAHSLATVCVTQKVLAHVNLSERLGQAQIALQGFPAGEKKNPRMVRFVVDDETYGLFVGDSHAAWRSHQNTDATASDFEALFAMLGDQPDARVVVSDLAFT